MGNQLSRRQFIGTSLGAVAGAAVAGGLTHSAAAQTGEEKQQMNVLFIAVDDLRPQLGCFGHERMISPNIDRLASEGTAFLRTHCQQAVCAPSRASILSGLRPDSSGVHDLNTPLRSVSPDVLTLPQHFKNQGYESISLGKIYHHGKRDDPLGWSRDPWSAPYGFPGHASEELRAEANRARAEARKAKQRWRWRGPSTEAADLPEDVYADCQVADKAIEELRRMKDRPFFLAAGFLKPHLAFAAPKKYWDLYPDASINLADNPFRPKDCPDIALHSWGELRQYTDIPKKGPLSDEKARELIHGYYACTSFIDAQVGKLLDELDRLGLRENTIIALWGDHGWNLGEHGLWCKHCNFETSTHSPLVISAPGQEAAGTPTNGLCEFVDIYPTLCDLSGVPAPEHLEGISLRPLMDDPGREWKTAAFSQYPRGRVMGYSMRTDRYRYTEWQQRDRVVRARELYDHVQDPGENVNVADAPGNAQLVSELSEMLKQGWQGALPKA